MLSLAKIYTPSLPLNTLYTFLIFISFDSTANASASKSKELEKNVKYKKYKTYKKNFSFPENFLFGVSSAATQVEDKSSGNWMSFAKSGRVRAFKNQSTPYKKLNFWSNPEVEIKLAKKLGVQIFRLSIEWERIEPKRGEYDLKALKRYLEILGLIQKSQMKVMLTLFHHSIPLWADKMGGFSNKLVEKSFIEFSKKVLQVLSPKINFLNTFNEPNVFALFSRVIGNWPPGKFNPLGVLKFAQYEGDFYLTLKGMAHVHREIYAFSKKEKFMFPVGLAQNIANYKGKNFIESYLSDWAHKYMNFYMLELTKNSLDFIGVNYYGAEYLGLSGPKFLSDVEYNDAGRAIDVKGFQDLLVKLYKKYKLPVHITENGIADEKDIIRPLYLIEHLKVISNLIKNEIPIRSYIYWTLSDNFEWSDGYCPKFGLISVDRSNKLERKKRDSFLLYQKIITEKKIDPIDEEIIFDNYKSDFGKSRPMCRDENGRDALDMPREIPLKAIDWRLKTYKL